jgi:hypothetical protein
MSEGVDLIAIANILLTDGVGYIPAGNNSFTLRYSDGYITGIDQFYEALNVVVTISSFMSSPTGSALMQGFHKMSSSI